MKVLAVFLTAAVFFYGCVSSSNTITSKPIYADQIGESPKFNDISTTHVGSSIYTKFDFVVSPTIKLDNDCATYATVIPKNQKLLAVKVKGFIAYVYHHDDGSESGELLYLTDRNSNDKIDHYKTFSGSWRAINPEIKFSSAEPVLADKPGTKVELIYRGAREGIIEISYREFRDDYTKPTLTKIIGYAINQTGPTTIAFKGAEIQILHATTDKVKYKVLSGFH